MRIFKSKKFIKFAKIKKITDAQLLDVVKDIERGKIDVDYGDGLIKQRIARENEGKSRGYRSIILYKEGDRTFFIFGFAKNDQENIKQSEKREFKSYAKVLFSATEEELIEMLGAGKFKEINQ